VSPSFPSLGFSEGLVLPSLLGLLRVTCLEGCCKELAEQAHPLDW
jgi:hypothetical protein